MKKALFTLNDQSYLVRLILVFAVTFPFLVLVTNIYLGRSAFWYDPARDLLLGLNNLSKLTLIGPTSGIPGIFYGPYWIWLLSFALFFSKDPRIVIFITATLPYFIIFPLVLYQFRQIFGLKNIILIWLFFIFSFSGYATQFWNPYPAPLFFLITTYLVTFTDLKHNNRQTLFKIFLFGTFTALTINFHISFGLGLSIGAVVYLLLNLLSQSKNQIQLKKSSLLQSILKIGSFLAGYIIIFIPFLIFETRHGFKQIQTLLQTIESPHAVVAQKGLTGIEILQSFFGRLGQVYNLPIYISAAIGVAFFTYLIYFLYQTKLDLGKSETRLFAFLATISICLLTLYLTAKNPVWNYHFIATEVVFLFIIALLIRQFSILQKLFMVVVGVVILFNIISLARSFSEDPLKISTLSTKEFIVNTIVHDARDNSYTVYPYSTSVYNYDYAYLFKLKGKDLPYDSGNIIPQGKIRYLIIPHLPKALREDFINFRSPPDTYKTDRVWKIPDGTEIIKRIRAEI